MEREKAIEILALTACYLHPGRNPDEHDAIQIGIDAILTLSLIQAQLRQMGAMILPGETERREHE